MNTNALKQIILEKAEWARHIELTSIGFLRYLINVKTRTNYLTIVAQYLDFHENRVATNTEFEEGAGFLDSMETVYDFIVFQCNENVVNKNGIEEKKFAPSTIAVHLSCLSQFFTYARGIDLSTKCAIVYSHVKSLNKKNKVPITQANVFTVDNMMQYYSRRIDTDTAHIAPYAIIAIHGCARSCEMEQLIFENVRFFTALNGPAVEIDLPREKDSRDKRNIFWVTEPTAVGVIQNYVDLLPPAQQKGRFWRYSKYMSGRWTLANMFIGKHSLALCGKHIATYLGLKDPDSYTSHTFKRTGATFLADNNASSVQIANRCGKLLRVNVNNF